MDGGLVLANLRITSSSARRAVLSAALGVAVVALLHSLVDFSMQIPGFAIIVFAIVGAGLSQSEATTHRRS